MVKAILDRHLQQSLLLFPAGRENLEACEAENETYRPCAEADVDAIIASLGGYSSRLSAERQEKP
jgi:hypothetical protein